jgi:signal recognition particle subunit SEC65
MEGKFEPTAKRKQIIEAYTGAAYQVAISAIEQETGRKMVGLDVRIFTEQRPPTMLEVQEQYVRRFVTEQRPKGKTMRQWIEELESLKRIPREQTMRYVLDDLGMPVRRDKPGPRRRWDDASRYVSAERRKLDK